jgi:hypothetical protein
MRWMRILPVLDFMLFKRVTVDEDIVDVRSAEVI